MSSTLAIIGDAGTLTRQAAEIARLRAYDEVVVNTHTHHVPTSAQAVFIALSDPAERAEVIARVARSRLVNLVHPTAAVSPSAQLGLNIMVGAQAVIGMDARVDDGVVQNALCSIEHDNVIGAYTFFGTGALLCGHVTTGRNAFVGAGARVKPGVTIGERATIGIGAVLVTDAEPAGTYVGSPAKLRPPR